MPELSVSYKDEPVREGLVLLKGALINTGSKDITESMVEERLSFSLPHRFKWLEAKVIKHSKGGKGRIDKSPQRLEFPLGLFRRNEFIRFEAIAEVPTNGVNSSQSAKHLKSALLDSLRISHRIADTQAIVAADLPPTGVPLWPRTFLRLAALSCCTREFPMFCWMLSATSW
jgi:hypothetical protein